MRVNDFKKIKIVLITFCKNFIATEIQNIQIAEGNVSTGISIPIYMIFPRLFSCSTTKTANFKIGKSSSNNDYHMNLNYLLLLIYS